MCETSFSVNDVKPVFVMFGEDNFLCFFIQLIFEVTVAFCYYVARISVFF